MTLGKVRFYLVVGFVLSLVGTLQAQTPEYVRNSIPNMFSYEELVQLSTDQELKPELANKLNTLTTTPFINNEAYYRGVKPHSPAVEHLGPCLRVVFWNIERGLELDDIQLFLTDKDRFMSKVAEERKHAKEPGSGSATLIWRKSRRISNRRTFFKDYFAFREMLLPSRRSDELEIRRCNSREYWKILHGRKW